MLYTQNASFQNIAIYSNNEDLHACNNYYLPNLKIKKYNTLKIRQLIDHRNKQLRMNQFRKTTQHPLIATRQNTLPNTILHKPARQSIPKPHPTFLSSCSKNRRIFEFWKIKLEKRYASLQSKQQKQNQSNRYTKDDNQF